MSFISLDNISFSYSDIESGQPYKNAVDGVYLNIEKGEFVAPLSQRRRKVYCCKTSQRNAIAG